MVCHVERQVDEPYCGLPLIRGGTRAYGTRIITSISSSRGSVAPPGMKPM